MEKSIQSPAQAADMMAPFTVLHFVVIGVLAALVVIGMLYGMRRKRDRRAATRELEARGHLDRIETGQAVDDPDAPGAQITADPPGPGEDAERDPRPLAQTERQSEPVPPHASPVAPSIAGEEQQANDRNVRPTNGDASASIPTTPHMPADADKSLPVEQPPVADTRPATNDDALPLTTLKGLGPKAAAALAGQGIATLSDLAGLDDSSAARVDAGLGAFAGRMARDRWVEQARLLTAGDRAGYETRFGKLG